MTVVDGRPRLLFLAVCLECSWGAADMAPWIFWTQAERDAWANIHEGGTGHQVRVAVEIGACPAETASNAPPEGRGGDEHTQRFGGLRGL